MVCGKGPSIGKKLKRELTSDIGKAAATTAGFHVGGVSGAGMTKGSLDLLEAKEDAKKSQDTTEQQGFTEADKEKLRRRQTLARTRLFSGLLSKGNVGRASLL